MPGTYIGGVPGLGAAKTAVQKIIFAGEGRKFLPGGVYIDGTLSRDPTNTGALYILQPGLLMGKVTATGLYAPAIIGVVTVAYSSGGTSLTVGAATAVELARRTTVQAATTFKIIGPPTAAGTVAVATVTFSAINQTTGVITVTNIGADYVAGSFISAVDGSDVPVSVIPDGYGIKATDTDNVTSLAVVEWPMVPMEGVLKVANIINYPTDTSLITRLQGQLNATATGKFHFDSAY